MRSRFFFALCVVASFPYASSSPILSRHHAHAHSDPSCELITWPYSKEILSQVSAKNIEATIRKLVSFGTRHTLSNQRDPNHGIGAARDWLTAQYREAAEASEGRMTVEWNSFIKQPGDNEYILFPENITSIVATLKGSEDPDRVISDPPDYTVDSPSASDECIWCRRLPRTCSHFARYKPKSTIEFTAFAGEEQDVLGGRELALRHIRTTGSISTGEYGTKNPYSVRLFCQGVPLTENATTTQTRLSIGGKNDSSPFTEMTAGYNAVRFVLPNEDYTQRHQDARVVSEKQYGDVVQFLDFGYNARVGKVNAAALWNLTNAPSEPRNVGINATASDSNTRFKRDAPPGLPTESYEIVYRATNAPLWTNAISVGNVNLANITLGRDNVIFGIHSVGKGGYKNPAVLPFPFGCSRNC
ncbi:hypothetical protein K469DRAFT_735954 [Zopfia rhizophila CBS 207.26]|uniref:Uncharacterized protein n=1 Tax=Zopfia rhizophila CBS 207.26 TaxID=1314779 RepID=A0A6A6EMB9_9PEZI|nr:hypothetical protein K469DRAFT_735954 [Zopfia rhizophila CBS 207.26]